MSALNMPKRSVQELQSILRDFLWADNIHQKQKIPLLAWSKVCQPKVLKGAGIRDLSLQSKALGAKVLWKLYCNPNTNWARLMSAKYLNSPSRERLFTTTLPKGSKVWDFISSCRDLILPSLYWLIHDGSKASVWDDSWNGFAPLFQSCDWFPLNNILKNLWGTLVCYYFIVDNASQILLTKCKIISKIDAPPNLILALQAELDTRMLIYTPQEDELIWTNSQSRQYSVKSGYDSNFLRDSTVPWPTRLLWGSACLLKAGAFTWLAIQDRVLTGMRLDRLGITFVFPCTLCGYSWSLQIICFSSAHFLWLVGTGFSPSWDGLPRWALIFFLSFKAGLAFSDLQSLLLCGRSAPQLLFGIYGWNKQEDF